MRCVQLSINKKNEGKPIQLLSFFIISEILQGSVMKRTNPLQMIINNMSGPEKVPGKNDIQPPFFFLPIIALTLVE